MKTRIIIDSASDLRIEEANKLGVILVPIPVQFKNESFSDGVDLPLDTFYEKLKTEPELPKTSQPSLNTYEEIYNTVISDGDEAVVLCLSSELSGTYNSAKLARENCKDSSKIHVIDTYNVCAGQRILLYYVLDLVSAGMHAEEICNEVENVKGKIRLHAVLDTLKYLKKGGRISPLVAFAGELMAIKPIVSVEKGRVVLSAKPLGHKKANKEMVSMVESDCIDFDKPIVFIYSGVENTFLDEFKNEYENTILNGHKAETFPIGCTIGTHIGPNAIGICYFTKD